EGRRISQELGLDGFMIGRGVFNNPWVFNENVDFENVSVKEKLDLLLEHVKLFESTWGDRKNFAILKKFLKIYVKGFDGAGELRARLMECRDGEEVEKIIEQYFES